MAGLLSMATLALFLFTASKAKAEEYSGVLTGEGQERLKKIADQRAEKIMEAIGECTVEEGENGGKVFHIHSVAKNGGVIKIIDSEEWRKGLENPPKEVDKPQSISGPSRVGGSSKVGDPQSVKPGQWGGSKSYKW